MKDTGTVTQVHGRIADVAVTPRGGCDSCNRQAYCSPGDKDGTMHTMKVRNAAGAVPGDRVEIELHPALSTLAAFTVFGVPLLAAVGGYFAGAAGGGGQERGALCSVGALGATFGVYWLGSRFFPDTMRFMPRISRILR